MRFAHRLVHSGSFYNAKRFASIFWESALWMCIFTALHTFHNYFVCLVKNLIKIWRRIKKYFRYIIFGELSYNIMHGFTKDKNVDHSEDSKYKKKWYCGIFQNVFYFFPWFLVHLKKIKKKTLKFRVLIIFTIQMYSSIMKGQRLGKDILISNNSLYIIGYAFLFFFILGTNFFFFF